MKKKKKAIWNHIPLNDVFTQKGEKSEKHLDKWTVSRIWSVEKISQTHAPLLYFFLLDVSQLPPWWLIMQSCLSIAELRERVWNPKEQLCQVNVHRKICRLRFRCRCSHFHIHSTDDGTAPSICIDETESHLSDLHVVRRWKTLLPFLSCDVPDPRWSRFINSSTQSSTRTSKRNDFSSIY